MADALILPDSSVWIESNRPSGHPDIHARVQQLLVEKRLAVTAPIRLEILCGVRTTSVYEELQDFFGALTNLSVTDGVWERAYHLGFRARRAGLPRLAPDILIASIAVEHDVPLWHCDRDFERLRRIEPSLRTYWHPHKSP